MSRRPAAWDYDERRNARIRRLRDQREGPVRRRRRVQPLLFLAWIVGVIALLGVLLTLGFLTIFAPRLMAWVEENPGAIEHGVVQDFVEWYRPGVLADEPASTERQRISVEIPQGATDTEIGSLLQEAGLLRSALAFQYQILQAEREGTLAFGIYDLSPTLRPSEILAALRGELVITTDVTILEGLRLEEIVGAFGASELTMNLESFANLVQAPPPELLNQYDFLNDLPAGSSLEGYLYPATYNLEVDGPPVLTVSAMLNAFGENVTQEIRDGIATQGLSIHEAVIIASIVEREAVIDEERPLIASVYLNRILDPQAETVGLLNADPTLQYGLGTFMNRTQQQTPVDLWGSVEWWPTLQVTGGEVGVDWPPELAGYQTYINPGMPPTPISAPRASSLAAVATAPVDDGYFYFVAGCPNGTRDGSHYFARTLGEHEENIAIANAECAGA